MPCGLMPFASPARTDHTCDNAFRSTVRHTIHEGSPARQRIFHGSVLTHSPAVKSQSFVGSAAGATALRLLTKVRRMEPRASRHRLLPLCRCREERGRAFESTPSQAHTQWNSPKNPYLRRRHRKTGPASELSSELLVSCRNTKSSFFKNLTTLPPDAVTNTPRDRHATAGAAPAPPLCPPSSPPPCPLLSPPRALSPASSPFSLVAQQQRERMRETSTARRALSARVLCGASQWQRGGAPHSGPSATREIAHTSAAAARAHDAPACIA